MRFPNTPFMWRTYDLAKRLDMKWLDYIMAADNNFYFFNNHRVKATTETHPGFVPEVDPFGVTKGAVPNYIDPQFVAMGEPGDFINNVIVKPIVAPFSVPGVDIEQAMEEMYDKYDKYSMRSYLFQLQNYSVSTADAHYMETLDKSTGWYDRALTETAIESLAFSWPGTSTDEFDGKWRCFDRGSSTLPVTLAGAIRGNITFGQSVNAIVENEQNEFLTVKTEIGLTKDYAAVISTVTLGCLSTIDLSTCGIAGYNYPQWSAIRELQYGPAIKIGVRWDKPWWQDQIEFPIVGGQSFTDLPLRTIVYPSYPAGAEKSGTLIVSYCWTQDAERLGALIGQDGQAAPKLIQMVIRDLAAVHGIDQSAIPPFDSVKDVFAWDWTHDPNTMGAYAFFGPGEFVDGVYAQICEPAAEGRLFFAGEATSSCHAWVAGALDSAWRAVYLFLQAQGDQDKIKVFLDHWGESEYWYPEQAEKHVRLGLRGAYKARKPIVARLHLPQVPPV